MSELEKLKAEIDQLKKDKATLIDALYDAGAHLLAATSAYQQYAGNKHHAGPRDTLFTTRLSDFNKSIGRVRPVLFKFPRPLRPKKLTTEGGAE